jgi:hypothetical protein
VSEGYLGDFTYRTHADFYAEYCGLDVNPDSMEGTTRERFTAILGGASPADQAKIIRGVLERFPVGEGSTTTRTQESRDELIEIAQRLEGMSPIVTPDLSITSDIVEQAISDAETLIQSNGPTSGVDRIHTALHGYLLVVCQSEGIEHPEDAGITKLFKILRDKHPSLKVSGARPHDIEKIMNAMSAIMDALDPIRNRASVAHPNDFLIGKHEAILAINAARTMLHYLDAKLSDGISLP